MNKKIKINLELSFNEIETILNSLHLAFDEVLDTEYGERNKIDRIEIKKFKIKISKICKKLNKIFNSNYIPSPKEIKILKNKSSKVKSSHK